MGEGGLKKVTIPGSEPGTLRSQTRPPTIEPLCHEEVQAKFWPRTFLGWDILEPRRFACEASTAAPEAPPCSPHTQIAWVRAGIKEATKS